MAKDFRSKAKLAWIRCMDAVGTSASNLASNAKHKVAEMNLETRRREILTDFSLRAYDLWQKGEKLPGPLEALLGELSEIDEKLSVLRAQRYNAKLAEEAASAAEESESSEGDETAEETAPVEAEAVEEPQAAEEPQVEPDAAEGAEPSDQA